MKLIISVKNDSYSFYIPKKDLESTVIKHENKKVFGGQFTLENGMVLYIEPVDEMPVFPKTFEAKRID